MEMGNREGEQKTFTAVGALCSGVREARSCAPNFCRGIAAFLPSPPGKGGGARGPGL